MKDISLCFYLPLLLVGCTTVQNLGSASSGSSSAKTSSNQGITDTALAIKSETDAAVASEKLLKDMQACEAGDFQRCVYGLPYGTLTPEDGKKLANGICAAPRKFHYNLRIPSWTCGNPNYAGNPRDCGPAGSYITACSWVCANPNTTMKVKDCAKAYGTVAVLDVLALGSIFPEKKSEGDYALSDAMRMAVIGLESTELWRTGLDEASRLLSLTGNLQTVNVKKLDGVEDHVIIFDDKVIGLVRLQTLPDKIDPQYYFAKAQEKYGKPIKEKHPDVEKLYQWSSDTVQRFLTAYSETSGEKVLVSIVLDVKTAKSLQGASLNRAHEREETKNANDKKRQQDALDSVHL